MGLVLPVLYNAGLVILLFIVDRYTAFNKLNKKAKQCIFGVILGLFSMYASEYGIEISQAVVNIRDAAPICAGLVFGAPAGVIAGFMGGTYRWLSVFWGAGDYTRLACTIATILAGIIAAGLRKYMFDDKRPALIYGMAIAVVCEIFHMLMILITNMDDVNQAFLFVKQATLPMVAGTTVTVGVSILAVSLIGRETFLSWKRGEPISDTFQRWLLACVTIAFLATSLFTFDLQSEISHKNCQLEIHTAIMDVNRDINDTQFASEDELEAFLVEATKHRHIGSSGFIMICDENMRIISDDEYDEVPAADLGLIVDPDTMSENVMYETDLYGKDYFFEFIHADGFYVIGAIPETEAMLARDASVYLTVYMQVLIFAILFALIYFLIKRIIINNLRKVNKSLAEITDGNLDVKVDVRFNEEFAKLSEDINDTVDTLKEYIAEAETRIDKELEYAKNIQLSSLPSMFPPYPDQDNFDIYAQMIAAREVGGDFYDFYRLDDQNVAVLIADVSGKGIPAAMFMMTAKTTIKDLAESGLEANEIFTRANEKLCENNEAGMFVTAWMGILDVKTGILKYANAGHNPPLIMRENGKYEVLKGHAGFVMAGLENIRYKGFEVQMEPGDRLFLYTDGVTEAIDTEQNMYGEDRLLEYMNRHRPEELGDVLTGLKGDIDEFVGEAQQFDDITMLILEFKNKYDENHVIEESFPARDDALREVLSFTEERLEMIGCPMKLAMQLEMVIEEVFINIARYAYPEGGGRAILKIAYNEEKQTITFRMRDRGVPFDPLGKKDPDITLSAEERDIGGLGILLCKKTMDEISYKYEHGENVLIMTKNL